MATWSGADSRSLEHEHKWVVPPTRVAAVRALLDARCPADGRHPENYVVSLYYDTLRLDLLEDKLSGALAKRKVRVRWYENADTGRLDPPAFLEVKYRFGSGRRKVRVEAPHGAAWYAGRSLADPELHLLPGRRPLAEELPPDGLFPFLVVRYRRRRYADPASASRISLDTEIGAARFNPTLLGRRRPGAVPHTVLEVKNLSGELPRGLRALDGLGALPSAFSKYAACFERCLAA